MIPRCLSTGDLEIPGKDFIAGRVEPLPGSELRKIGWMINRAYYEGIVRLNIHVKKLARNIGAYDVTR